MTEEERKKYYKHYYLKNREKILKRSFEYRLNNLEYCRKYRREYSREYYVKCREKYLTQVYIRKRFSRFISLEEYLLIQSINDIKIKKSIMIKLGKGLISGEEAVFLAKQHLHLI
jgi:hypothetical protein